MAIQDEETDWLLREFARRRGVGITAAVKLAVEEAMAKDVTAGEMLARKIEPILSRWMMVGANRCLMPLAGG